MSPSYRKRSQPFLPWKKNSIAYRLTFRVIVFSTLIALLATVLQLYLDYQQDVRGIYAFFTSIAETSIRPLEESVWILDDLQVNLQLEGLIKRQDIVYAAVEMDDRITWAKGAPAWTNRISHSFSLFHQARGSSQQIGQLHVVASLDGIYQRLLRRIIILLASNAVKTFLVSGFILLLFQRNITQHLTRLADDVQGIDIRDEEPEPLRLDRSVSLQPDELDSVITALNFLCQSGSKAFIDVRKQEQRLRLFFDATEEAVLGVDPCGRCTFINRAGRDHFAIADEEALIGCDILEMLSCHGRALPPLNALCEQIRTTIREKKVLLTDEIPLLRPDGSSLLISLRSYPVVEKEQCTGAIVFFADISRQQKLEQEKQLFTKVIRQAPAPILITDAVGTIEYVNASFEQIMRYDADELTGKKVFECLNELNVDEQVEQVRVRMRSGEAWIGTFTGTNAWGRRVNLDATIFPILDRQGQLTHVVAMARDATREQQLLEQLHQAQKMEAIGKLAASIAHEFGNPLLGIRFALRDVQQHPEITPEDRNLLHLAENECDRMRKLIRDLQHFHRPSTSRKAEFDLHRLLDETLILHNTMLAKGKISIVREYDSRGVRLYAVEDQIRQVIINLFINASDAMSLQGGSLTIGTTLLDEEVLLTVGDDGPGIKQEDMRRIFEPFFTTKSAVEGTGLGLPVSYGIVCAHGGTLEVHSEPGKTVFTIKLPLKISSIANTPESGGNA